MSGLGDSLPWRLAFYNAWDQWGLPLKDSIKMQAKRLATQVSNDKLMAVVPISSFIPDFNTFSVLPNLLQTVVSSTAIVVLSEVKIFIYYNMAYLPPYQL
ncbi:unnamed protein product [Strongylus vulgaris]|uniref:Uncharacterized protein n=1 Tax=Strongylus vulgaris TaxID=40348 RepID=A0A3P7IUW9_STRVU|nr:unnamed protein product [Strongylus vulgaris]